MIEDAMAALQIVIPLTEDGIPYQSADGRKALLFVDLERSEDALHILRREADRTVLDTVVAETQAGAEMPFLAPNQEWDRDKQTRTVEQGSSVEVKWRPVRWNDQTLVPC